MLFRRGGHQEHMKNMLGGWIVFRKGGSPEEMVNM